MSKKSAAAAELFAAELRKVLEGLGAHADQVEGVCSAAIALGGGDAPDKTD